MRVTIVIITIMSFTAVLLVSCAAPTRVETDYGTSYKLQIVNQTANPEAGKSLAPVEGLDGQAAANTMTKYRKEFERQEKAPSNVSNISNVGNSK